MLCIVHIHKYVFIATGSPRMWTTHLRCSSTKTSARKCCCTPSRVTTSASLRTDRQAPASPTPWWESKTSKINRALSRWYACVVMTHPINRFSMTSHVVPGGIWLWQRIWFTVSSSTRGSFCYSEVVFCDEILMNVIFPLAAVWRSLYQNQRQHKQQYVLLRGGKGPHFVPLFILLLDAHKIVARPK